jgi:hypothetical protein
MINKDAFVFRIVVERHDTNFKTSWTHSTSGFYSQQTTDALLRLKNRYAEEGQHSAAVTNGRFLTTSTTIFTVLGNIDTTRIFLMPHMNQILDTKKKAS